jgi:hypothetical protein
VGISEAGLRKIIYKRTTTTVVLFFLKFLDTRFNSHSIVSPEIVCDDCDTRFKFTFLGILCELPRIKV